jgi:hypothetical protein
VVYQNLSRTAKRTESAFLALCTFIVFFIGHLTIVALHGFRSELALTVLGQTHDSQLTLALVVWLSGLAGIVVIHAVTTVCSRRRPRFVQKATQSITDPVRTFLFGRIALETDLLAALPYRAIGSSLLLLVSRFPLEWSPKHA